MVRNTPVLELLYVLEVESFPIGEMFFFFLQSALKQICKSREKEKNIYDEPLVDSKQ